jgi:hypothetical protein
MGRARGLFLAKQEGAERENRREVQKGRLEVGMEGWGRRV